MQLAAMDPRDRVVRVQHLSQLAEDVLGHVDHELGINHLAELVSLEIDTSSGATHSLLVLVETLDSEVVLSDVC